MSSRPMVHALASARSTGRAAWCFREKAGALDEVLASLQQRDMNYRMLPVNYAFHSAQMAPLRDEFVTELGYVRASDPSIQFISTVTGTREIARPDAEYFGRNMREPVRFAAAAQEMLRRLQPHC